MKRARSAAFTAFGKSPSAFARSNRRRSASCSFAPAYNTSLGMTQEQVDEYVQSSIGNIPLGCPGTTDEIAKSVSFLVSDDGSYVNGIELFVDSGLTQIQQFACH